MNKKAQSIGMKNTIFSNCHGLDEETKNYSTAYDMALLSSYAYNNYPLYKKITGTYKYEVQTKDKSYLWINRNKLLKMYKYATGGNTGYTPSAGRTLVTTASKDNFNVTIVSLDDSDFYNTHKNLYNDIYNNYKYYKIIDKHHLNMDNTFYKDNIYVKKSFSYPLTNEEKDNIKIKLKLTKIKHYKNNEKVGVIDIYLNNNKIKQVAVFVHKKKENKNLFSKIFSS